MASASWLHGIVSASAPGGAASLPPAVRLARFLGEESAARLVETVHGLAGKTSAALREDAFLVTINGVAALAGAGHNVSLDNLVRRRRRGGGARLRVLRGGRLRGRAQESAGFRV